MTFKTGILLDSLQLSLEDSLKIASETGADGVQDITGGISFLKKIVK